MADERWATFDCYGTLIDWDAGIRGALARVFGAEAAGELLDRYHELEPALQAEEYRTYREVMNLALARLADERRVELDAEHADAISASLPSWEPFPEVPAALAELRERGCRLAILSNCDRDLIEASVGRLGVPVDEVVVAEDVRSYKPAHGHWEEFFRRTRSGPERHVHVAASLFHDIAPANQLGLASIWINRRGEPAGPFPTRELPDLRALPDTLEELRPA